MNKIKDIFQVENISINEIQNKKKLSFKPVNKIVFHLVFKI